MTTRKLVQLAGIDRVLRLVHDHGAHVIASHSAGKDSQAQYIALIDAGIPADRIIVIHADLGEAEWPGVQSHIADTVLPQHRDFIRARGNFKDGSSKDFFSLIRYRRAKLDRDGKLDTNAFPGSGPRFCTSDLKTGPIWREAKRALKARGVTSGIIINAVGIRADESGRRSKKVHERPSHQLTENNAQGNGTWQCFDWWPLAYWTTQEVFDCIADAGQQPHWAYADGNDRLSCRFCIFGSPNDLQHAAKLFPELYAKYVALESEVRSNLHISNKPLQEICGIPVTIATQGD